MLRYTLTFIIVSIFSWFAASNTFAQQSTASRPKAIIYASPNYSVSTYRAQPSYSVPSHRPTNVAPLLRKKPVDSFYGNRYPKYQSFVSSKTAPVLRYPNYSRRVNFSIRTSPVQRSC